MSLGAKNYLLLTLLLLVPLRTNARSACQTVEEKLNSIDSMVDYAMKQMSQYLVGLGVGIVVDGEIVSARGYGLRNISDAESHVTNRTIFAVGSCTKAFTSFAVDCLRKDGLLDWSDLVIDYVPEFRMKDQYATKNMQIKDLAAHLSGLPRHDWVWQGTDYPREELLKRIPYLESSYGFRERFQYNNIMYAVQGILVERASNRSWEDFVRERILQPLQMTRTYPQMREAWNAEEDDIASGHDARGLSIVTIPYIEITNTAPCCALVSTALDMSKWVQAQLLLSGRSKEMHALHAPMPVDEPRFGTEGYGLGWFVGHHDGRRTVYHAGNVRGFAAYVSLFPDEKVGVAVLINSAAAPVNAFRENLARKIADIFHGCSSTEAENKMWVESQARLVNDSQIDQQWEIAPSEGNLKVEQPDQYVGSFVNDGYGILNVSLNGTGLVVSFTSFYDKVEATKVPDHFIIGRLLLSRFERNSLGDVVGLYVPVEATVSPVFFEKIVSTELYVMKYLLPFVGVYGGKITIAIAEPSETDYSYPLLSANGSVSAGLSFTDYKLQPVKTNWFSRDRRFFEFVLAPNNVVTQLILHEGQLMKRFRRD